MAKKRLRVIAGPNGSGKSTLTDIVKERVHLGVYVNADEIKVKILNAGRVDFSDYGLSVDAKAFFEALDRTTYKITRDDSYWRLDNNGVFFLDLTKLEDYFVTFLAEFIRTSLLEQANCFTFETVMSHPSKLDFMEQAKACGFKVYLYFVSLPNPELNVLRVKTRVKQGGHDVDADKIKARYDRTMDQLFSAIKIADSAYIFDNSGAKPKMIAQKEDGKLNTIGEFIPVWYHEYVLKKIEKRV